MTKIFLFIIIVLSFSCNNQKPKTDYLGVINITVSGNEKALRLFEKGLLLLHSFEYADSREAFKEAQKADPKMAMAYWGEAMTYNHGLWGEQNYDKGIATLNNLKENASDVQLTELEDDFLESIQILYQADKAKNERDQLYADFMKDLYIKYPDNHEVAAFYALSLLGSVQGGRDYQIYGQGAEIAKGILEENPNHPGALHYLIHSYDDPAHASMALDAANSYSKVAPDASHALHMPSHIYVALGMWDEVVSSNENSYQASLNKMERKDLGNNGRGYHAYHWLEYGYLQKGRVEDAKKMVLDLKEYVKETPSSYARRHLVFLKGTFLMETDLWNDPIADINVDVSDLNVSVRSQYQMINGMKAFKRGENELLEKSIKNMEDDYKKESLQGAYKGVQLCSGVSRSETSENDLDATLIRLEQLYALRAWLNKDIVLTEEHLRKSISLNDKLNYSYGPPSIQKPTNELYAEWLVLQKRLDEALEQYELTLKKGTNRSRAIQGKKMASRV